MLKKDHLTNLEIVMWIARKKENLRQLKKHEFYLLKEISDLEALYEYQTKVTETSYTPFHVKDI